MFYEKKGWNIIQDIKLPDCSNICPFQLNEENDSDSDDQDSDIDESEEVSDSELHSDCIKEDGSHDNPPMESETMEKSKGDYSEHVDSGRGKPTNEDSGGDNLGAEELGGDNPKDGKESVLAILDDYYHLDKINPELVQMGALENDCDDEAVEDLTTQNRMYKPFRNTESMQHQNSHLSQNVRSRNSDSLSMMSTSSVMDPSMVKHKVKSQKKRKQQQQFSKRVRKSGEAAIQTKIKRENQSEIKLSLSAEWY